MKIIEELKEEIKQLKVRITELSIKVNESEKKILDRIKRGWNVEDGPFYDIKHLDKPVRSIVADILEEQERLE